MNICSLIVQTRPDRVQAVEQGLLALPSVEVHGSRTEGKLIVAVEDVGRSEVADTLAAINGVADAINAILTIMAETIQQERSIGLPLWSAKTTKYANQHAKDPSLRFGMTTSRGLA